MQNKKDNEIRREKEKEDQIIYELNTDNELEIRRNEKIYSELEGVAKKDADNTREVNERKTNAVISNQNEARSNFNGNVLNSHITPERIALSKN